MLASLMDEDGSNPLCGAGVEALQGAMRAQKYILDCFALVLEHIMDHSEQTIIGLAWLIGNTNRDCEKEMNIYISIRFLVIKMYGLSLTNFLVVLENGGLKF
jgi:hypothetical protein